ncbi:MAG: TetR/AcrR family transcriptional regulator [Acidimicrobiales bacterium]
MAPMAASATAPRRRLTAVRRRRQLIDVALETFSRTGYAGTTMEEIASAAGVTKPLLYQHFASKRALYLELIDDVTARLVNALTAATADVTVFRRQVEAGMLAYFGFMIENQSAVRMLYDAPHDEELARGLRSIRGAIAEFVSPLIAADIEEDHRRTLAVAVVGMTEGVTEDWLSRRRQRQQANVANEHGPAPCTGDELEAEKEATVLAERVADFAWRGLRGVHRAGELGASPDS